MPKAQTLNLELLLEKLSKHLSQSGPSKAKDLCKILSISQAAFSRLITQAQNSILRLGEGSQTLYALLRSGAWGKSELPILMIAEKGQIQVAAILYPLSPQGFYLKSHSEYFSTRSYPNLPYFLEDLRPAGFLGRLIPRLYPEQGFPEDISLWNDDDCLLYLYRYGWDLIGNLVIGEKSYNTYVENRIKRLDILAEKDRKKMYPKIAELVLSKGIPGSSAAGEQPKFLSIRKTKKEELIPVLVKFSPPLQDAISHRIADLLICEQIAHEVLRKHGKKSPASSLLQGGDRLFLEIERFDRNSFEGRRGVISLRALDLEFVGQLKTWSDTGKSLLHQKIINSETYEDLLWLEVFGKLIANTDRHHGNISFFCEGENILSLAPVYDMLPMLYAPQQNQLVPRTFEVSPPKLSEHAVWKSALNAASDFWLEVLKHAQISEAFKVLTQENGSKLGLFS